MINIRIIVDLLNAFKYADSLKIQIHIVHGSNTNKKLIFDVKV